MIRLKAVDQTNFEECVLLERKSQRYVGSAAYVLAEAYIYRHHSTAYGVYADEKAVGLVLMRDMPKPEQPYAFTNLFIADSHQGKGYGRAAIAVIIETFKAMGQSDRIEVYVHETNKIAIYLYRSLGFVEKGCASWDRSFVRFLYSIR